jgi:hypothetical protein
MPCLVSHEGTVLILHCFFPNVEWIKFPADYMVHQRKINTCSVQYHHCRSSVFKCHPINGCQGEQVGMPREAVP